MNNNTNPKIKEISHCRDSCLVLRHLGLPLELIPVNSRHWPLVSGSTWFTEFNSWGIIRAWVDPSVLLCGSNV